jgi:SecD/SecF fusion protein
MIRSVKWRLIIIGIIVAFSLFSLYPTLRWATLSETRRAELTALWDKHEEELREDLKWYRLTPEEKLARISGFLEPLQAAYKDNQLDQQFWQRVNGSDLTALNNEEKEDFLSLCEKLTGKDTGKKIPRDVSGEEFRKAMAPLRKVQKTLEKDKAFRAWVLNPKWDTLKKAKREEYRTVVLQLTGKRIARNPSVARNVANWFTRWWKGDENQIISLGLDLRGGTYFVLEVEKPKGISLEDATEGALRVLSDRINITGVREPIIQRQGINKIVVQLPGTTDVERQRRLIERQASMRWMLVAEDHMKLEQFSETRLKGIYDRAVSELDAEFENKKDRQSNRVEWTTSDLDRKLVDSIPPDTVLRIYTHEERGARGVSVAKETPLLLRSSPEEPEVMKGGEITRAMASRDPETSEPIISFALSRDGTRKFAEVTREYNSRSDNRITDSGGGSRGWRLAILLDEKVISAPHIKTEILGGSGQIEGNFTTEEARDLAIQLKAGALPAKLNIVEQNTVGPTLGADSVRKGIFAAILGLVLVVGFMLVYYLGAGLIANLALVLNMVIILGAMAALRATLTLPGIAGIILTIGMAVDANVLINERIREELAGGKKIAAAIEAGYQKAFLTIFDSNLTTVICGVVLYYLGTGPVRGFAVTLIIGLATSMFTAIVVTRVVFDLLLRSKRFQRLPMLSIVRNTKYDFVAQMRKAVTVSIVVIVAGIISFAAKWSKNFGIDFTSGQSATVVFQNEVTPEQLARLRSALASSPDIEGFNLGHYKLQRDDVPRGVTVVGKFRGGSESKPLDQRITDVLSKENPRDTRIEPTVAKVYPVVAKHLWKQALIAVFVSLLAMLVYIWWRFEFRFALGGIIALFHDVLVTVAFMTGFFILTRRQLNLSVIAAILAIIGYSINDTIVIFDRIREDMKIMKGVSLSSIINTAVNQTFSRTILTSFTTLLAVVAIFAFGGQAINDFAFAMLVGCISGVYSTVYIASPIALLLQKTR